jgi:CIC family chloride channel protein
MATTAEGFGRRLVSGTEALAFANPGHLAAYAFLAILCAAAALYFRAALNFTRATAQRARIPAWAAPAAAGLLVGAIACALPQVMDHRYGFLQKALDGTIFGSEPRWWTWAGILALVALAKLTATALMIGTQTSGGLFGPLVFAGGAVGAAAGAVLEAVFPGTFSEDLRRALIPVGMAGVMAASMRVPMAAIVMVTEMTGSYGLIVPLMLVGVLSYILGRRWGVYREQVGSVTESPAHAGEAIVTLLERHRVRDVMVADWPHVVGPGTPLADLVQRIPSGNRARFAVVDHGRLVGLITTADVARAAKNAGNSQIVVAADIMALRPKVAHPDDDLYEVLKIFRTHQLDVVPVVDPGDRRFRGMLTRDAVREAVRARLREERAALLAEHGGLAALADDEQQIEQMLAGILPEPRRAIHRMEVPAQVVGKSLREAGFRRRYQCEVVAIELPDGAILAPPDPDRPLGAGEVLITVRSA